MNATVAVAQENVVIVEDELFVALDLQAIAEDAGHRVVAVVDDLPTAKSVNLAPTLALVDVNLRDGPTGPDAAQHFNETFGSQVVFITANPEQVSHRPANALGIIVKPFRPETVRDVMAAVLAGRPIPDLPGVLRYG